MKPALRRTAALLEVLGVAAAGPLLMWGLRQLFGVSVTNPLSTLRPNITNDQLLVASGQMFVLLMFQYGGYFLLALPLNWWYRRRGLSAYGLTRSGRSWKAIAAISIGTAAWSACPLLAINFFNSLHNSDTVAWRQALMHLSLLRWQVWLFTGVMSWALVPVLEELFFRGYCLRRLAEDWGNGAAIVGSACLFAFAHSQYFIANVYNVATLAGLLFFAVGVGVAFALTRSLIPCIAAHVMINLPMSHLWQLIALAVVIPTAVISWRTAFGSLKQVFRSSGSSLIAVPAIGAVGYDLIMTRESLWTYSAMAALLAVAVLLETRTRRETLRPAVDL